MKIQQSFYIRDECVMDGMVLINYS